MNTCTVPLPIRLHRPWWRRLVDALRHDAAARRARWPTDRFDVERLDDTSLAGLSPALLKDIGAPPWIAERRRARDEAERLRL